MTCTQLTTTIHHPIPSAQAATRVSGIIRRWWRAYWDWRARQATVIILQALDERTLRDIGVSPCEIASFVYGKRGERRRGYDETWRRA
jgi:uncharacterized protein YjiS (DUF1127 family)